MSLTLLVTACGGGRGHDAAGCGRGFVHGSSRADGIYFAYVSRRCGVRLGRTCAVGDANGPIATEHVDAGIDQDCVAFSQFIGAGVGAAGECSGNADSTVAGHTRRDYSRWRCAPPLDPERAAGPERLPSPSPSSATIAGHASDPVGRPPAAYPSGDASVRAPPWAVLIWHLRDGSVCHEPGQVVRGEAFRGYAAYYDAGPPRRGEIRDAVGSLRPDAKFGVGRQYFHFGRFLPYPLPEGGSCGDPNAAAGLIFSREFLAPRHDLGAARTIVEGVAGPRVAEITVAGRRMTLAHGAFIVCVRGRRNAASMPLVVTYRDGGRRRFAG